VLAGDSRTRIDVIEATDSVTAALLFEKAKGLEPFGSSSLVLVRVGELNPWGHVAIKPFSLKLQRF